MQLGLQGQVAVVVGAASGIGRAVANEFTSEQAEVVWMDRDPGVAQMAESTDSKAKALALVVDATDYEQIQSAAAEIIDKHGRCDHVIVTIGAGSGKFGFPFWNLEPSDWYDVLNVNLVGVVNVLHAFVPHMLPAKRGTFCVLSSVAGQIGSQTDPPYSAAKAAIINFAQCAAKDLAPYNIRVNAIAPGMVKSPLNRNVWESWRRASDDNNLSYEEWGAEKSRMIAPLARWQEPEEMAAVITFLASERARNITGQTLNVDGGQHMHS